MNNNYRNIIIAVFLTSIMIGSPIATAVGGASIAPDAEDDSVEISDNASVWERSALPLRVDTADATTVIETPENFFIEQNGELIQSPVDAVGVYKTGTVVNFDFQKYSGANIENLNLTADTTQIHAVKLNGDASSNNIDRDDMPNTLEQLRDVLNKEDVNSNATFENLTSEVPSNYNGESLEFTNEFDDSGMYAVMVTKHESGKEGIKLDSDDNLDKIDGEVLIGGVETVAVQQNVDSTAGAPASAEPGESLEFDTNANLEGVNSDVNHIVAVYKKDTFRNDDATIVIPDSIDSESDLSSITLKSDIGFVSGSSNVEDDITLFGRTLNARSDSNQFSVDGIISRIATEANTSEPTVDDGETILNASATGVVDSDSEAKISVETLDNWETGEYQYLYIAAGDDSSEFATDGGTLTIEAETDDGGDDDDTGGGGSSGGDSSGGGSSGGSSDTSDEPASDDEETTDEGDDDTPSVDEVRQDLDETEPNTQTNTPIVDNDPDRPGVSVSPEGTESVREITFSDESASGNVDVREWQDPPESVSRSVRETVGDDTSSVQVPTVADIEPDSEEVRGNSAEVTITVDSDRVDDPEDAVIVHERDNSWETLETTVDETSNGEITLTAETESFSLFAVAEVTEDTQAEDGTTEVSDDDGATGGSGSGPGTPVIIGVLVVLALVGAVIIAYNRQSN